MFLNNFCFIMGKYIYNKLKEGRYMQDNINEKILTNIKEFTNKKVIINQLGFIESEIVFENFMCSEKNDILKIYDENNNIYLKINLNQAYNIEKNNNIVVVFLDNDTQIKLRKEK